MASNDQQAGVRRPFKEITQTGIVLAGVLFAAVGWSALIWLFKNTLPTVPNRWLFFALLQLAVTGTALPIVYYLHQRFQPRGMVTPSILVRQATWVGLFATICAWLKIPRLLSVPVAVVLAIALIIIEALLRLREITQWRPE